MKPFSVPTIFCLVAAFSALASGQPPTVATVAPEGINFFGLRNFTISPGEVEFWLVDYDGIAPLELNTFFNNANGLDTEIGLYNAAGDLVGFSDDANGTAQSQLEFVGLDAGLYYLAVGLFNTNFAPNFNATSTSNLSGTFAVQAFTGPEPTVTGGTFAVTGADYFDFRAELINPRQVEVFKILYDGFAPLRINTFNSPTDTEIGLYSSLGFLIAQNDDTNGTSQSQVLIDDLSAGVYYLLVGHFNTIYNTNGILSARSTSDLSDIVIVSVITEPVPNTDESINIVGHDFMGFSDVAHQLFEAAWLEVNYDGVAPIIINTFFNDANGFDTELGLYDSVGNLIATNDDANASLQSRLVLKDLPAGTYYLAAALFDTSFGPVDFDVNSNNAFSGNYRVDFTTFPANVVLGDVNGDGAATLLDVAPFIDMVSNDGYSAEADINCDAVVNLLDINPFVAILTGN